MTRLTVDAELQRKLLHTPTPIEICDKDGNVLGIFTPKVDAAVIEAELGVNYDELQQILRDGAFISTSDLLSRLENV